MNERKYYYFYEPNGRESLYAKYFTAKEAKKYMAETGLVVSRCFDHFQESAPLRSRNSDAWKPGWHHGLGMRVESRRQYEQELKKRNLVEAGTSLPSASFTPKKRAYLDNDTISDIRAAGGSIDEATVREVNDVR